MKTLAMSSVIFHLKIIPKRHSYCIFLSMTKQLKRTRDHIDVSIENIKVEDKIKSKYFKKELPVSVKEEEREDLKVEFEDYVDVEWVKKLENKEYFGWISKRTSDDLAEWGKPLNMSIFLDSTKSSLPDNFIPIYSRVRLMRSMLKTPVDTMGCSKLPITVSKQCGIDKSNIIPKNYRLQILVGVMLSAQTKDEVTAQAVYNITEYCINELDITEGITLEALLMIDESVLDELIHSVGFHNRKAKFIKDTALLLEEQFESDVPSTIDGFLSLPGVGPKMGYLALQKAWGKVDGICVDVHVHRLVKMWKWVDEKKCKTPEHTRKSLESWLPRELWYEINSVLVGFGQVICESRVKRCDICLNKDVCNAREKKLTKKTQKTGLEDLGLQFKGNRGDYSKWLEYLNGEQTESKVKKEELTDNTVIKTEF